VLDIFVKDLVTVSHKQHEVGGAGRGLGSDIEEDRHRRWHIESLAKSTRLIALNARIEAHRAGEAARRSGWWPTRSSPWPTTPASSPGRSATWCRGTHQEPRRAKDAVTSLASHDLNSLARGPSRRHGHHGAPRRHQRQGVSIAWPLQRAHRAAIRGMQFEDILSQLLGTVGDRVGPPPRPVDPLAPGADDRFPQAGTSSTGSSGTWAARSTSPEPFNTNARWRNRRALLKERPMIESTSRATAR